MAQKEKKKSKNNMFIENDTKEKLVINVRNEYGVSRFQIKRRTGLKVSPDFAADKQLCVTPNLELCREMKQLLGDKNFMLSN
jgi:hypothetical protein